MSKGSKDIPSKWDLVVLDSEQGPAQRMRLRSAVSSTSRENPIPGSSTKNAQESSSSAVGEADNPNKNSNNKRKGGSTAVIRSKAKTKKLKLIKEKDNKKAAIEILEKEKDSIAAAAIIPLSLSSQPLKSEMELNMDSSDFEYEEYEEFANEIFSGEEDKEENRMEGNPKNDEEHPFTVMNTKDIVEHMTESIKEANNVLQLSPTTMRILLNHFNWDRDKLLEAYYDGDQDKLFKDARIVNPSGEKALSVMNLPSKKNGLEECEICYESSSAEMMYGLECGHRYCKICWSEYLTTKIVEEGMGQTIACAAHKCTILVDDKSVTELVKESQVKLKYQHLITNSFVQCNQYIRWCPSKDCTNAIRVQWIDSKPKRVICSCNFTFCFQCGHGWHDPIRCQWLKKWLKKCDEDLATLNWISANTKDCPKCDCTIEKNGGCNHMVCKNQNCQTQFCWMCLGPWESHGNTGYNCNSFDGATKSGAKEEKSRPAIERYLFYLNRYMAHNQSLKFEQKLYLSVKEKMEQMQQHNMSWIEVQFLNKAVDILVRCRQNLMYTYVFAFYLEKTNTSAIFEDNQKDLETATEQLSGYLERDITSANLDDIKQKVQDKVRYCESRLQVLLDHVHEGQEKDEWIYNTTL